MALYSQNVDIYTDITQSMTSTVDVEVQAIQDCSQTTGCNEDIDTQNCSDVTYSGISFDCETSLNTECQQSADTQVSVQNDIEQSSEITADTSQAAMTCGASAGGSAALLSGGASASCALPQSMTMKQETYIDSSIDLLTQVQSTYENDCSTNFGVCTPLCPFVPFRMAKPRPN